VDLRGEPAMTLFAATALADLAHGTTALAYEAAHIPNLAGLVFLWRLSRLEPVPPSRRPCRAARKRLIGRAT
jgi:hypothetical protein